MPGPVVSLLPARNASADLPAHLESVARFADAVVALDDGSTDDTRQVLESHPLVHTVLHNPRREGYGGWDDAENRNRLLEAAQSLSPSWVMSLDADELVTEDDAAALRRFLLTDADPDDAYLFRVFRMIGDLEHHDGSELWVGRLFAPRPEHRFPSDRLHFVPLPTTIDRERWRRTTVRIQHGSSLTEHRRRARYDKYGEADPDRTWQRSYEHLLAAPSHLRTWHRRGRLLPVLAHQPVVDPATGSPEEPAISVVVVASADASSVERVVGSVVAQDPSRPFEVVVVASAGDVATQLRRDHPGVVVVEVEVGSGPGAARNRGLAAAAGRHLLFLDDATVLRPGHLEAILAAHEQGWPMVAGTVQVAGSSRSALAAQLLDRSAELPGRGSFAFDASPRGCSFHRELLAEIGGFAEDLPDGVEAAAARELFERGYGAYRTGDAVADRHGPVDGVAPLLADRFRAGRTDGVLLVAATAEGALTPRRAARNLVRSLPGGLRRVHRDVERWGAGLRGRYLTALPLVAVGAAAGWTGAAYELARGMGSEASRPLPLRRRSR